MVFPALIGVPKRIVCVRGNAPVRYTYLSISFNLGLCLFQRLDRRYAVWGEGVGQRVFLVVFENQLIPELLQACRPWWIAKKSLFSVLEIG